MIVLLTSPAHAAPEFWINPGSQLSGDGSQADPWTVASPEEFDAQLRKTPAHATIHLGPGVFETYGAGAPGQPGFIVKNGWSIQGAGIDKTVIRLVGCLPDEHPGSGIGFIFFSGWGPGVDRIAMRDFTADCNAIAVMDHVKRQNISLSAIYLMGSQHTVQRVKAINAIGRRGRPGVNPEAFVIRVGPRDANTDATGYFVEDCEVSSFQGGAVTAIALLGTGGKNGATGAFRRNQIVLQGSGGEFGFSAYGANGFVIEHNVTHRAARAFNWDTAAPGRDLIIRNNRFLQCTGSALLLGGGSASVVEDNVIELSGAKAVGVMISARNKVLPGASGWVIRNNVFQAPGRDGVAVRFYGDEPAPGCTFTGNRIEDGLKIRAGRSGFRVWRNNVNREGRIVAPE
jgi:hypothetical protein